VAPTHAPLFQAIYRVGVGAAGNVAADTITLVTPSWANVVTAARNPFAVTNGADAETPIHIQRSAPQAFRAQQFRAVRPEDYEAAAESLPWVLKAGTSFRWTGSWLTVFTAADPRNGAFSDAEVAAQDQIELIQLLDRRRLAGYESYSPLPVLVSIDLEITVCVMAAWLPNDVERLVLDELGTSVETSDRTDFFFSDNFTFGTPLYRSRLEAAIQSVSGVRGVLSIRYRRRGTSSAFLDLPEVLTVGASEILRIDNDPSFPERGTIRVIAEGGR
jgi:predicted phage baseplate assembly protein